MQLEILDDSPVLFYNPRAHEVWFYDNKRSVKKRPIPTHLKIFFVRIKVEFKCTIR
jgi:hypothetical protein